MLRLSPNIIALSSVIRQLCVQEVEKDLARYTQKWW